MISIPLKTRDLPKMLPELTIFKTWKTKWEDLYGNLETEISESRNKICSNNTVCPLFNRTCLWSNNSKSFHWNRLFFKYIIFQLDSISKLKYQIDRLTTFWTIKVLWKVMHIPWISIIYSKIWYDSIPYLTQFLIAQNVNDWFRWYLQLLIFTYWILSMPSFNEIKRRPITFITPCWSTFL